MLEDGINPGPSVIVEWKIELRQYIQDIRVSQQSSQLMSHRYLSDEPPSSQDSRPFGGTLFDYGKRQDDQFAQGSAAVSTAKRPLGYERESSQPKRSRVEDVLMEKLGSKSGDVQKKLAMGMLKFIADNLGDDALSTGDVKKKEETRSYYSHMDSRSGYSDDRCGADQEVAGRFNRQERFEDPKQQLPTLLARPSGPSKTQMHPRQLKDIQPNKNYPTQNATKFQGPKYQTFSDHSGPGATRRGKKRGKSGKLPAQGADDSKRDEAFNQGRSQSFGNQFMDATPHLPVFEHSRQPLIKPLMQTAPGNYQEPGINLSHGYMQGQKQLRPRPLLDFPLEPNTSHISSHTHIPSLTDIPSQTLIQPNPQKQPNETFWMHDKNITGRRAKALILPRPKKLLSNSSMHMPKFDIQYLLTSFWKDEDHLTTETIPEKHSKKGNEFSTYILMLNESSGYNYTRLKTSDINPWSEDTQPGHPGYPYFTPLELSDGKIPSVEFIAPTVWKPGHEKVAPMTRLQKEVASFNLLLYGMRNKRKALMKKLMNKKDKSCTADSEHPVLPQRVHRSEKGNGINQQQSGKASTNRPSATAGPSPVETESGDVIESKAAPTDMITLIEGGNESSNQEKEADEQTIKSQKEVDEEPIKGQKEEPKDEGINEEDKEGQHLVVNEEEMDNRASEEVAGEEDDWEDLDDQNYPSVTDETNNDDHPAADTTGDTDMKDVFEAGQDDFIVISEDVGDELDPNEDTENELDANNTNESDRADDLEQESSEGHKEQPTVDDHCKNDIDMETAVGRTNDGEQSGPPETSEACVKTVNHSDNNGSNKTGALSEAEDSVDLDTQRVVDESLIRYKELGDTAAKEELGTQAASSPLLSSTEATDNA